MKKQLNPQSILRIASKFERLVAEIDEEADEGSDLEEQQPAKTLPIDNWLALNKCSDSNDLFLEFKDSVVSPLGSVKSKISEMALASYKSELGKTDFKPVLHGISKALEIASGKYHAGLLQRLKVIFAIKFSSEEYRGLNIFQATRQLLNKIENALPSNYGEESRIESMKSEVEKSNRFADWAKSRLEDAQYSYVGSTNTAP